jgi:hypothetical protein
MKRQQRENPNLVTVGKSVMCAILKRPDISQKTPVQIMGSLITATAETLGENDFEAMLFRHMEGDTPQRFIYYPGDASQRTYFMPNAVTEYGLLKGGRATLE